jgi:exonuclease SbcC
MTGVEAVVDERIKARELIADEARAALPDWIDIDVVELDELIDEVAEKCRLLSEKAALAERSAQEIEEKLAAIKKHEVEIKSLDNDAHSYSDLALELRSDHIVQFLQGEALAALAAAAGDHMSDLSDGRYRLLYEDERFLVIDSWNADEMRSVRTLSGGETFLASLALALGLSEQVQLLAVTERSRLESLFLDEGFGTLDSATLDTVVNAVARLGREDRLVGVVTHVQELADAMPVRLRVEKSPRGSKVEVAAS